MAPPRKAAMSRPQRKSGVREAQAQASKEAILKAATKVFAKYGYEGGSIDKISKAAQSYDRMIYYYFGSKEGLFIAVLERIYHRMNEAEAALALDLSQPAQALNDVIRFVLRYYRKHPEFVTLLNTENLHKGRHIAKSLRASEYSSRAVAILADVLRAGTEQGLFRHDLAARDVYLLIAATGYFYMSNRYTLTSFLGESLDTSDAVAHWEGFVIDTVWRTVRRDDAASQISPPTHDEVSTWQKPQPARSRAKLSSKT